MERIKQAIEKAKQQRESAAESVAAPVVETVAAHIEGQAIAYSQTRTIEVPADVLEANRLIGLHTEPGVLQAYKMLRTQVLQRMGKMGWNALAVTSPNAGEGKTLTAINLALSMAQEVNNTVLLIDLDLRKPGLIGYFGHQPEYGLSDYLIDDVPLQKIMVHPGMERLVVLPGRQALVNSSEMLSSPKMVRLVDELKNRYASRIIIFDLPPLLSVDDALAFAPYVDAALLVVEEGGTRREDLARATEMLKGTELIGTVLNRSQDKLPQPY